MIWVLPAIAAAQGAASLAGAFGNNRAVRRSVGSAREAAVVEARQIADQAALEARKNQFRTAQTLGRLRVLAAEGGAGGSLAAYARAAEYQSAYDDYVIQQNAYNRTLAVGSQFQAQALGLLGQRQSIAGTALNAGLNIASAAVTADRIASQEAALTIDPFPYGEDA